MNSNFISDCMVKLCGKIDDAALATVRTQLAVVLQDYDVTPREKSLSVWHGQFPDCYMAFMIEKKIEGMSVATLEAYKRHLEIFLRSLDKPIEEVTVNDIRVYLYKAQETRQLKNTSLDTIRSALSSFFSWSAAEGYLAKNPMATIKPIKCEQTEVRPLSRDEMERVRNACENLRQQAIVEFLYSTGCRISEMIRLNISDVNFFTSQLTVFGKGSKERKVMLSSRAKMVLHKYLESRDDKNPALFVGYRKPHNRVQKHAIEKEIREIGKRCGIEGLHPHQFRHTVATHLMESGMPAPQIQKYLGHVSLDTTMIYAKVSETEVFSNHEKFIA